MRLLRGRMQEVLVGEDLVPEVLDRLDLGEEAVAADVEAPAVALDGAGDAADHVVGLEDRGGDAVLVELEGGGEPGRAGADDHDLGIVHPGWRGYGLQCRELTQAKARGRSVGLLTTRVRCRSSFGRGSVAGP